MIVNTGGRTDTVQYYTPWLLRRFEEGYALTRNPLFPSTVTRYELTPDKVDCVLFKNHGLLTPVCCAKREVLVDARLVKPLSAPLVF